jgi:hypothetical protein
MSGTRQVIPVRLLTQLLRARPLSEKATPESQRSPINHSHCIGCKKPTLARPSIQLRTICPKWHLGEPLTTDAQIATVNFEGSGCGNKFPSIWESEVLPARKICLRTWTYLDGYRGWL